MTPDELRAYAAALVHGTHYVDSPELHEALMESADYLRACADEKPVGVYVHRPAELRYGVEWLVGDPMPNGTQLFTHPAPVAPQAEPKREALSEELLPARVGQPLTMTIATDEPDGGHWYSPDFVRERIRAAYERAAQECEKWVDGNAGRFFAGRIRALGRQHD